MAWGTFSVFDYKGRLVEVHVAPCNPEGKMYAGHVLSGFCECCPVIDKETEHQEVYVYIHHQLH